MPEIWRDIKDYEGLYQISNLGRVRSLDRFIKQALQYRLLKGRVKPCNKNPNGYLKINLCKNGNSKTFLVHRLVAQAFLPNPNNLPEVNHKDENKENNYVDNLEWCTSRYNNGYSHGKPVLQYTLDGQFVAEYPSAAEASRKNKIIVQNICSCCNYIIKSAGGYIWKYKIIQT